MSKLKKLKRFFVEYKEINEIIFVWYIFSFVFFLPISILCGITCYRMCFIANVLVIFIMSLLKNKKLFMKKDIELLAIVVIFFIIDILFRRNDYTLNTYYNFFKYCYIPCWLLNRTNNVTAILKYASRLAKGAIIIFVFDPIFKYYYSSSYMGYGFLIMLPAFSAIYSYHFLKKEEFDIVFMVIAIWGLFIYGNRTCMLAVLFMVILTGILFKFKNWKNPIRVKECENIMISKKTIFKYVILIGVFLISFGINYFVNYMSLETNEMEGRISFRSYSLKKYEQAINGQHNTILSGRGKIYPKAIETIKDIFVNDKFSFILGKGTGYFRSLNEGIYTHSIIFDLIIEYGIVGTLGFGLLLMYCIIKWLKNSDKEKFLFGAYWLCQAFPKLLLSLYFQKETGFWAFIMFVLTYFTGDLEKRRRSHL